MNESRRVVLKGVAALGGSYVIGKTFFLQDAVAATEVSSNHIPIIDEQPPATATFVLGVPASIPYGRGHHPSAEPLAVGLELLPQGFTIGLVGDQIMLHWDGAGAVGTYHVRAFLEAGSDHPDGPLVNK